MVSKCLVAARRYRDLPDLFCKFRPFLLTQPAGLLDLQRQPVYRLSVLHVDGNELTRVLGVEIARKRIASKHQTLGGVRALPDVGVVEIHPGIAPPDNRMLDVGVEVENMTIIVSVVVGFLHRHQRCVDDELAIGL